MFKKFKTWIAAGVAAVASIFGTLQYQAGKVDAAKEQWRTEHLAGFVACPYMKAPLADYMRAWDRTYPYGDALFYAYAKNQSQYFPDLTPEMAKVCFTKPTKGE